MKSCGVGSKKRVVNEPIIVEGTQDVYKRQPLINYEGRYSYGDHLTLRLFCRVFGVSKTTASIRLRQLGYMVDRPFSEYVDPCLLYTSPDARRSP